MIFGKIEYLNLLPFHTFMKRYLRASSEKKAWIKCGGVPATLNRRMRLGRIDAAVVSSIVSPAFYCVDLGIVADGAVWSVLVHPGESRKDAASDTSNALAGLLGLEGEVIIGDRALRRYFEEEEGLIDLGERWKARTGLPFVYARLCARSRKEWRRLKKIEKRFDARRVKIPWRILKNEAENIGITPRQAKAYLQRINYRLRWREDRALKQFLSQAKKSLNLTFH